jgi:hypothetical protein
MSPVSDQYLCCLDAVKFDVPLILGDMPRFFLRCAVTRDLYDLIIELRPSTTSGGLAENIKRTLRVDQIKRADYIWLTQNRNAPARISQDKARVLAVLQGSD